MKCYTSARRHYNVYISVPNSMILRAVNTYKDEFNYMHRASGLNKSQIGLLIYIVSRLKIVESCGE